MEKLKSFASGTLAYHGHHEFRSVVPPPLLMECTTLMLNEKNVDIGGMSLDRINKDEEDLGKVTDFHARMLSYAPAEKRLGGKEKKKGKK